MHGDHALGGWLLGGWVLGGWVLGGWVLGGGQRWRGLGHGLLIGG
jgi:hypothetical protein